MGGFSLGRWYHCVRHDLPREADRIVIIEPSPPNLYRQMLRIRRFEERVLAWFPRGIFYGTTHTYIGQEADAVGVMTGLQEGDVVVSNHRCHGHFLAYGGPMEALAAELMGRSTGVCGGRGGSQHVQWGDFYANGILGGTLPLATGMALAEKVKGEGAMVAVFLGDGALGEGVVYEATNMAALWQLPLLFILENNRYAQSTPIELNLSGSIAERFSAFGLRVSELDTTDVERIAAAASEVAPRVREGGGPEALIIHTYRLAPHSKGDDSRDPAEIERYRQHDPLPIQGARLSEEERRAVDLEVQGEVERAFQSAEEAPLAAPDELGEALERLA